MTENEQASGTAEPRYRSGTAARLCGVPVETLRMWERRYGVTRPRLSPRGQRLYSAMDVRRLLVIKQLVDLGQPIGTIARLEFDALMQRYQDLSAVSLPLRPQPGAPAEGVRVVLTGARAHIDAVERTFRALGATTAPLPALDSRVIQSLRARDADIIVISLQTMRAEDLDRIRAARDACGARAALVLYRFAPSKLIYRLRQRGVVVLRPTEDDAERGHICRLLLRAVRAPEGIARSLAFTPDPPRFTPATLAAIAARCRTVACECPRHLVELVTQLMAFEDYSAQCVEQSPSDAALHRELGHAAAIARSIVENALDWVVAAEGLIPATAALPPRRVAATGASAARPRPSHRPTSNRPGSARGQART